MAAAEYYSGAPMGQPSYPSPQPSQAPQLSQQQQQGHPHPHSHSIAAMGSPGVQSYQSYPTQPPPPYQAIAQDQRPSVHFSDPRPQRNSFSSQAPIPVIADQQAYRPQPQQQQIPQQSPQPQYRPSISKPSYNSQIGSPRPPTLSDVHAPPLQPHYSGSQAIPQKSQYLSPYIHPNQSQPVMNGYTSDPERQRHRRRRYSNDNRNSHRDHRDSREERPRKTRSRSTNADGFIGAAGGGLIGDLIFPGLGTVGGALAGWIGGKDYGKHRKGKEEKLDRDQARWEHRYGRDHDARQRR